MKIVFGCPTLLLDQDRKRPKIDPGVILPCVCYGTNPTVSIKSKSGGLSPDYNEACRIKESGSIDSYVTAWGLSGPGRGSLIGPVLPASVADAAIVAAPPAARAPGSLVLYLAAFSRFPLASR